MNMVRLFEFREDRETGSLGWVPKGAPSVFNTGGGRLVAHDVLEHRPNTSASWEDELMALGAMVFIRGETGHFYSQHRPDWESHLAADLRNCFEYLWHSGLNLKTVRTNAIYGTDDGLSEAIEMAITELKHEGCDNTKITCERTVKTMKDWLRVGYRHARKRYHDNAGRALYLFTMIERDVDELTKQAEEGFSELKVSVSIKNWTVDCQIVEPQYNDYY